jgi:hypothetical protein
VTRDGRSARETHFLAPPPWLVSGDGCGVTVAVLDSGFSRAHPALRGAAVAELQSFVGGDPSTDATGHGTACCGVLLACPDQGGPTGVARGVRLFVGQTIDEWGQGSVEALCAALTWIAARDVDVVAIPSGRMHGHATLRRSIRNVLATGAIVVAPVGNPFRGQHRALYPAAYRGVLDVGSAAYSDTYEGWHGTPGVVVALRGRTVCTSWGGWRPALDTSHATMLVAGFAALVAAQRRALDGKKPTPDEILGSIPDVSPSVVPAHSQQSTTEASA